MKKIIIIFIFSIHFNCYSQDNLSKYWHYRYRLVNDFMVVGPHLGESLPATARNQYNGNRLMWGESPRYLGWYIGVLATEYKLLQQNNQPLNETIRELYYAIHAVIRLDSIAETKWNKSPDINGFLIRDDVPADFISQNDDKLNNGIPNSWPPITYNSGKPGFVNEVSSNWSSTSNFPAASQDMIYELLLGMALVTKCVDDNPLAFSEPDVNGNMVQQPAVYLRQMSIDEADKIISYIKKNTTCGDTWEIDDPNCNIIDDDNNITNGNIGQASAEAQGIAHAGNFINFPHDYTDNISEISNATLWQNQQNHEEIRCTPWNVHMALDLAAIGDSWVGVAQHPNTTAEGIRFNGYYDKGSDVFCSWEENHYRFDLFFGMLHRYLHNYDVLDFPGIDLCEVNNILNSAPYDGIFYHSSSTSPDYSTYGLDNGVDGWRCTLRFSVAPPDQTVGNDDTRGNYNGLDYMLFFNLYNLVQKYNYPPFLVPHTGSDYFVPDHFPYIAINSTGEQYYPGSCEDPGRIESASTPVIVDGISITNLGFLPPADLTIYGGSDGVLIKNITVENDICNFLVYNAQLCYPSTDQYIFIPSAYHERVNSNNNEAHPSYSISDEFKQVATPNILITSNPNSGIFTIECSKFKIQNILITDILGKVVYRSTNPQNSMVDISSHPKGIYLVKVQAADKVYTEKVVVR